MNRLRSGAGAWGLWGSRTILVALLLVGGNASAQEPPVPSEPEMIVPGDAAVEAPVEAPVERIAAPDASQPAEASSLIEPGDAAVAPDAAVSPQTSSTPEDAEASAEKPEEPLGGLLGKSGKPSKLRFNGYYWVHYGKTGAFAMDERGGRDGLNQILDHRMRVRPTLLVAKTVDIVANIDILAGQLAGDTTSAAADILLVPRDRKRFTGRSTLRELYLEWRSAVGLLRVGQMHSQWGLGMVAHSGEDDPEYFADTMLGDRVDRIQWTMKPAAFFSDSAFARGLHLSLGADLVFQDDHASLLDGDLAWQAVGALFWQGNAIPDRYDLFAGVYVAYRNQKYDNGDRLEATAIDLFTRHSVALDGAGTRLNVAAEGVIQVGHTNAFRGDRAHSGVDVLAWGAVVRAEVEVPKYRITPGLELGLASGDADREDGTSRAFSFDPDYRVGMILFPELLGRTSAWSASRVADPTLQGMPSKGYDLAITNGAVTNALYLYPRLKITAAKGLDIRLAFLWAWASAAVSDPFNANVANGGYPVGYRGGRPSHDLGYEIDVGVSYTTPKIWGPFAFRLGLQGGWAKPGAVFDDANGNALGAIYKIRAMADLTF